MGAILLIWSIQQFSLLGPRQQIYYARTHAGSADEEGELQSSALTKKIAAAAMAAALLLLAHVAGLFWAARGTGAPPVINDLVLYFAPMLVLWASAWILWFRKRPPYAEAKLTGQFMLILAAIYIGGLAAAKT